MSPRVNWILPGDAPPEPPTNGALRCSECLRVLKSPWGGEPLALLRGPQARRGAMKRQCSPRCHAAHRARAGDGVGTLESGDMTTEINTVQGEHLR